MCELCIGYLCTFRNKHIYDDAYSEATIHFPTLIERRVREGFDKLGILSPVSSYHQQNTAVVNNDTDTDSDSDNDNDTDTDEVKALSGLGGAGGRL